MGNVQRSSHRISPGTNTLPREERKTKQNRLTEDILDFMEKEMQVQNNEKNMKHCYDCISKIGKKFNEVKEKWINDKCRNIEQHHRRCTKTSKKSLERKSAHPQDV